MPRKIRSNINSNFLHIMVQGLNKEYIFNKENEIKRYLNILKNNKNKFNLEIVAYCIMNNHAHLLIFSKNINEVSKFMKNVNTRYAIYYNKLHNRCGYVFRDRYRVEEIYSEAQLLSCINYIHNNPVKANMCRNQWDYKYSSYNNYIKKDGFINEDMIQKCFLDNRIEYGTILKNSYERVKFIDCDKLNKVEKDKIIDKMLKEKKLNLDEIKSENSILKDFIITLNIEYGFLQKEIAEILQINKVKVNRILRKKD